ncbi:MAG: N-acetylmuramoyl-L-alanine amidase [Aeromonadaceae bacterium]
MTLLWLVSACSPTPHHYRLASQASPNQDSRVQYLVLHYTQIDDAASLYQLTRPESRVSAHYLLSRDEVAGKPLLYPLVPESQRAWHAGRSHWQGAQALNSASIGIEIVNLGYDPADSQLPLNQRRWQPYTEGQIQALAELLQTVITRYQIKPSRILGHSDIAPGRKVDPGPRFPWQRLYQEFGIGIWPDEARVKALLSQPAPPQPDLGEVQRMLVRYGYQLPITGKLDEATRTVLTAFQLHFRPSLCNGEPDRETLIRLQLLLEKSE